jgi:DNA (cytosine-5)-methyltransferase 1
MKLLDLFCKAGGCTKGYQQAGFYVVGVDIEPQPHYCGDEFIQADALTLDMDFMRSFDAIHASPPCQAYSTIAKQVGKRLNKTYPDLVSRTRQRLVASMRPFIIENVPGAPLNNPITLCGSNFGLNVRRHRAFELYKFNIPLLSPCAHFVQKPRFRSLDQRRKGKLACVVGVHGHVNYSGEAQIRNEAMGIDWMTQDELSQAIPPAYTKFIGEQLMKVLEVENQC